MKNTKILNIFVGVVMVLGLILWIRTGMADEESLKTNAELQASILNPFSYLTFLLLVGTACTVLVFSILNLVKHPNLLKKSLMGLGALLAILVVAYLIAPSEIVMDITGKEELANASVSKWVSTGIWYSMILGGLGILSFVVDFAKSLTK